MWYDGLGVWCGSARDVECGMMVCGGVGCRGPYDGMGFVDCVRGEGQ